MIVLLLLYLVIPGLQAWFLLDPSTSHLTGDFMPPPLELGNYIVAVLLYHAMLANIMVATRLPWVQRLFPQDAKVRFHIGATAAIVAGFLYHAFFKIFDGKDISNVTWALLAVFAVFVLASLLWTPVPGFQRLRKKLHTAFRKISFLSYNGYKKVHNVVMLALALLMFWHITEADVVFQDNWVSTGIYLGYLALALGLFTYSKLRIFFLPRLRLSNLEVNGDVLTLRFQACQSVHYRPGQFAYLRFYTPEVAQEGHPFSLLSAPGEPELAFSIRALGDFTHSLKGLAVGAQARIDAGYGAFNPSSKEKKLCFISSGIGIVPFISILKALDAQDDPRPVKFFISVNEVKEIPEFDRLQDIARRRPQVELIILEQLKEVKFYDQAFFRAHIPDPGEWKYLVCASPKVHTAVVKVLRSMGIRGRKIKSEQFSFGAF